ncbi:hypothetical protein TNCV_2967711 [Trichonephila clavipes]|nr:hypothetical protein TNCV_2967711 [Trichonephila clavipes]
MVKTDSSDHSRNFGTFGEFLRRVVQTEAKSVPQPDEIGKLMEPVVDVDRQINSNNQVDSDDIPHSEQLNSHN